MRWLVLLLVLRVLLGQWLRVVLQVHLLRVLLLLLLGIPIVLLLLSVPGACRGVRIQQSDRMENMVTYENVLNDIIAKERTEPGNLSKRMQEAAVKDPPPDCISCCSCRDGVTPRKRGTEPKGRRISGLHLLLAERGGQ